MFISSSLPTLRLQRLQLLLLLLHQLSASPPSAPGRLCSLQLRDWGWRKKYYVQLNSESLTEKWNINMQLKGKKRRRFVRHASLSSTVIYNWINLDYMSPVGMEPCSQAEISTRERLHLQTSVFGVCPPEPKSNGFFLDSFTTQQCSTTIQGEIHCQTGRDTNFSTDSSLNKS